MFWFCYNKEGDNRELLTPSFFAFVATKAMTLLPSPSCFLFCCSEKNDGNEPLFSFVVLL